MRTNAAGIALIKKFESCDLKAYPDPGTGDEPWTIGWGHVGANIYPGMEISQEQADKYLDEDLAKFERGISQLVRVTLNENQFSALVCFSYNVGLHNLSVSHLLIKVNNKDFKGAAEEFLRWNKSNGEVLEGLTERREAEKELFLS
jgi:lysozyme